MIATSLDARIAAAPHAWLRSLVPTPGCALVVILALAAAGCGEASAPSPDGEGAGAAATPAASAAPEADARAIAEAPADEAPAVRAALPVVDLQDLEAIIAEADANDRVLVIDFWATWCVPCVAMFPDVHAGLKTRGDAVRPISVTLDDPGAMEAKAIAFLERHDAMKDAYRVLPEGAEQARIVDALGQRWQDVVIPAFLVFDQDGKLAGEFLQGGEATVRAILDRVDELTGATTETGEASADAG